jgi:ABC-2 type transport system permease protein
MKHILKQSIRANYKLWITLTAIICFFMAVLALFSTVEVMGETFPLGALYGAMLKSMDKLIIVFACVVGIRLVVSEVDRGSMSFTLNTPITRKTLISTKLGFFIASISALVLCVGIVGGVCGTFSPAKLDYIKFIILLGGYLLYALALCSIAFFASCFFNKTGQATLVAAGVPIAFVIIQMLSAIKNFEWLKYATITSLYDEVKIVEGDLIYLAHFGALAVIAVTLFSAGALRFLKKDLPL